MISERYKKALVTVYMGFRSENDIKKNGLQRFTKRQKEDLVSISKELFNKNQKLLLLKIKPTGFRSEHILIEDEVQFKEILSKIDEIFGKDNEIWIVSSSAKECWRGRIYIAANPRDDRVEMAYSFDDHILDHIDKDVKTPYILYTKSAFGNQFFAKETNLSKEQTAKTDKYVLDMFAKYAYEIKKVREDLEFLGLNGISLDVRIDCGYDFHDFDVGYEDVKRVIDFYVPKDRR